MLTSHARERTRGIKPGATVGHLRMIAGARSERVRSTSTAAARVQNSSCDADPTVNIACVSCACQRHPKRARISDEKFTWCIYDHNSRASDRRQTNILCGGDGGGAGGAGGVKNP